MYVYVLGDTDSICMYMYWVILAVSNEEWLLKWGFNYICSLHNTHTHTHTHAHTHTHTHTHTHIHIYIYIYIY